MPASDAGAEELSQLYYRCRYTQEYALANNVDHPTNVYLPEHGILPSLDDWLARCLERPRLEQTLTALVGAQDDHTADQQRDHVHRIVRECDAKLETYRQALEAGTDPALVAGWTADVQARKAEALGRLREHDHAAPMTRDQLRALIDALGDPRAALRRADPDDKAAVYRQLGLRLTYHPTTTRCGPR